MRYHGASPRRKCSPQGPSIGEGGFFPVRKVAADVIEEATLRRATMTARSDGGSSEQARSQKARDDLPPPRRGPGAWSSCALAQVFTNEQGPKRGGGG
jgi:hypothetical protein